MRTIAIIAAVLTISLHVGAQGRPPNTDPPANSKAGSSVKEFNAGQKTDESEQAHPAGPQVTPCNQAAPCHVIEEPQAKSEEQQTNDKSLEVLYRRYMWATIWGVAGAFIGLGIIIWQTAIARTTANAAKESADATIVGQRAWIMAEVEPDSEKWSDRRLHVLQGSGTSGDSTAIYALVVCTNLGKSPAWIDEIRAKFEIAKTLPVIPNFEAAEHIETGTIPLGMAEGGAIPYIQKLPWTAIAVGHQELGKMNVIYGFVRYRDIFQKSHLTTFGYRITNGQIGRLEGKEHQKYNDQT